MHARYHAWLWVVLTVLWCILSIPDLLRVVFLFLVCLGFLIVFVVVCLFTFVFESHFHYSPDWYQTQDTPASAS